MPGLIDRPIAWSRKEIMKIFYSFIQDFGDQILFYVLLRGNSTGNKSCGPEQANRGKSPRVSFQWLCGRESINFGIAILVY
jgi:hypothetical protein